MKYSVLPLQLAVIAAAQHTFVARDTSTGLSSLTLNGPASIPGPDEWTTTPLNPSLASFSIETAFFEEYLGNVSYPNTLTSKTAGVAPQIRIGGITADSTMRNPNQDAALYNYIDASVLEFLPDGTQIVMTLVSQLRKLDMDRFRPRKGLGKPQLHSRKPDQYYLDFDAQNYMANWEPWSVNISKALDISYPELQVGATVIDPLWPYNTSQAEAQFDCTSALAAGADDGHTCSEHTYQYSDSSGYVAEFGLYNDMPVPSAIQVTDECATQVNHTRLGEYLDLWQPRIHAVRSQLRRIQLGIMFRQGQYLRTGNVAGPLALQGSTQLNHGGHSFYNLCIPGILCVPICLGTHRRFDLTSDRHHLPGSSITTADGDPSAGQLSVYGYWDHPNAAYLAKLAILNLEIYNSTAMYPRPNVIVDFSVYVAHPGQRVTARTMIAPGAEIKDANVTTSRKPQVSFDSGNPSQHTAWVDQGNATDSMEQGQEITPETQCAIIRLSRLLNHDSIATCLDLSTRAVKRVVTHFDAYGTYDAHKTIPYGDENATEDERKHKRHLRDVDVEKCWRYHSGVELTQRSAEECLEYLARIGQYEAEQLVFVDESSLDRRATYHGRAWSIKGTNAQRKSFLLGLCTAKSSKAHSLLKRLRDSLNVYLATFPAPNSIIIMDKCRLYNNPEILDLIHVRGMRYEFLPSCSRDLNPVELAFSSMKDNLRGNGGYEQMATTELSDREVWLMLVGTFYNIPSEDGYGWYSQCGYNNFHKEEQEPQSCSTRVLARAAIPPTLFVFPEWGPPPAVCQATIHNPGCPGTFRRWTIGDRHEARNKDGITFSLYGPVLMANGFPRMSQLPFDSFKLTDCARQWNMKERTAVFIIQYAKADLAAVRSGQLVIPKMQGP
ncbi:hypothetical protein OG21DRAFT_1526691 [Imleria badia]|nr:hypothetical protein OG21DRAFT_1526691 [Imleria badia]